MTPSAGNPWRTAAALDETACAAVAARFGRFAAGCLMPASVWSVTLAIAAPVHARAALIAWLAQAAVLAIAWRTIARRGSSRSAVAIVFGATLLVAGVTTLLLVGAGLRGEVVGFALFTLCALTALIFPWGWRRELVLTATLLMLLAIAAPWTRFALDPPELLPVITIAAVLCVAIAEGHARNFRATRRRQWSEEDARRELAASRDTYRGIAENARDFIWSSDLDGRITYINEAGARILGFTPAEIIGRNVDQYVAEGGNGSGPGELRAHLAAHGTLPPTLLEWRTVHGRTWVEILAYPVHDANGAVVGFHGISRDVTERSRAEAALRESEARYRGLVESQSALIYRADLDGNLTFLNEACRRAYGVERAALDGLNFLTFVHPDEVAAARAALARIAAIGRYRRVSRGRTPHGWMWIEWEVSAITDAAGMVAEVQGVGRNVSEQRAADEALQRSLAALREREEQLRLMSLRQTAIREEERKRLGFDLHEGVCQELVGIGILIESARQRGVSGPAEKTLGRAQTYLRAVAEHLRLLARELRPLQLADLGLGECLRALAKGMATEHMSVTVGVPNDLPHLAEETAVGVYRVAQEAIANAARHANARRVSVVLESRPETFALEVRDDGRGFERATLRTAALGLVAMEERAAAIGGRLRVQSAPGGGTIVRLECPYEPRAQSA